MITLIVLGVSILITLAILVTLLNRGAENKQHASYVRQNTAEFVVAGGKLLRPLLSVPKGLILTTDGKLVETLMPAEEEVRVNFISRWLRDRWGYYWVSWFWPLRKIHKFKITKERLDESKKEDKTIRLRDMIASDPKPIEVDHLRLLIQRPFLFEQVETKDNFAVDIILLGLFRVVDLVPIPFIYQERFFPSLKAAVSGALMDWMKDLNDYEAFLTADKGKGSPFSDKMKEKLKSISKDFGLEADDIWMEVYQLVSGKEIEEATQAKAVAELRGQAKIRESELNLKAAENNANALVLPIKKSVEAWGDAVLANRDIVTQNLGKGSIGTLVMGSDSVVTTLPIGGRSGGGPPTVPTTPPPPTSTPTTGP